MIDFDSGAIVKVGSTIADANRIQLYTSQAVGSASDRLFSGRGKLTAAAAAIADRASERARELPREERMKKLGEHQRQRSKAIKEGGRANDNKKVRVRGGKFLQKGEKQDCWEMEIY